MLLEIKPNQNQSTAFKQKNPASLHALKALYYLHSLVASTIALVQITTVWGISTAYRIYIILFHCSSLHMSGVGFGQRKTFLTLKTSSLQTLTREAFMCGSLAAKASPRRHSPPSSDPQYPTLQRHFVQPSATGDVTEERCAMFLLCRCYYAHHF